MSSRQELSSIFFFGQANKSSVNFFLYESIATFLCHFKNFYYTKLHLVHHADFSHVFFAVNRKMTLMIESLASLDKLAARATDISGGRGDSEQILSSTTDFFSLIGD